MQTLESLILAEAVLAFSMTTFLPNITAVVNISDCTSNTATDLTRGRLIPPVLSFNLYKISVTNSGFYDDKEALEDSLHPPYQESCIPLGKGVTISFL